jgi:hypothetical protein
MVEQLVSEFVPDAVDADPDFSALQRVNPKFSIGGRSARRREADVVWRVPTRRGESNFLYLMLEFQSDIDCWMHVRTQVYQGLLWQQVIREMKLSRGARLPPILSIVLYNGDARWRSRAPFAFYDKIRLEQDSALWNWQPEVHYYLLDMGDFSQHWLTESSSLLALLFRLEQKYELQDLEKLVCEVAGWFRRHEGFGELKLLFGELVRHVIETVAPGRVAVPDDFQEMKCMLARLGETWKSEWRAEGLAAGKAEGKAEGLVEGKTEALLCLLTSRFGTLPHSYRKRINGAKLPAIERWFKRALKAPKLSSVFGSSR